MPSENDDDDMDDKWPARKNPALLAGAELVQNDEQAFIPPYWVKPYDCPHCHSKHVGVCVALTAGVCSSNKTTNVVLSLEKENTELVIDMRLPRYLTKHKNVSDQLVKSKFGQKEGMTFQSAMIICMASMRTSVDDPFVFRARIPLGLSVNPVITEKDWHIVGDTGGSRVLNVILKTPTTAKKSKGRCKEVTIMDEFTDSLDSE